MDELPLTADDLLAAFDRADADAGLSSAAQVDGYVLRQVVDDLLDTFAVDDAWDLPPRLFGLAPVGHVERATGTDIADQLRAFDPDMTDEQAAEIAGQLRAGTVVSDDDEHVSVAMVEFPLDLERDHPYDAVAGMVLPAWVGAVILVTESWLHLRDKDAPDTVRLVGVDPVRRSDGAVEARTVLAVTRLGSQVTAVDVRGGGRQVDQADEVDGQRMSGRMPGALARTLGIPAVPVTDRPWMVLGGVWAKVIAGGWDTAVQAQGAQTAAASALQLRPDLMVTTAQMLRTRIAQLCERHGVDPTDDQAMEELIEAGHLSPDAVRVPLVVDVLAGRASPDDVARVDELTLQVMRGAGWEGVRQACLAMVVPLRDEPVASDVLLWLDGALAMLHTDLVISDADAAAALRQVAGLRGAPPWFRESTRRFRKAAEALRMSAEPNPHLTG